MPLQAVEPRRLYREIADQIRSLISSGECPLGSRLPPERDIARQLGVSRTSVREALIALEIGGLVEVRGGSGIYVAATVDSARPLSDASDAGPGPFELLRARWLVEGEIAALAARSIDAETLKVLEDTIRAIEASGDRHAEADQADRNFHVGIAEATDNSALVQTVRMYWDQRSVPMWTTIAQHFQLPALRLEVVADHRAILAALRNHDPATARRAMRRHIERIEREFAKGWKEARATDARGARDTAVSGRDGGRTQRHR